MGGVFEVPVWSPGAFLKVAHRTKAELPGDPRSLDGGRGLRGRGTTGWVHRELHRLQQQGSEEPAEGCSELEAPLLPDCPSPTMPQRVPLTQDRVPGARSLFQPPLSLIGRWDLLEVVLPLLLHQEKSICLVCFLFSSMFKGESEKFQNRVAISALPTSERTLGSLPRMGTWFSRFWDPQP